MHSLRARLAGAQPQPHAKWRQYTDSWRRAPQLGDALLEGGAVRGLLRPAPLRQPHVCVQLGPGLQVRAGARRGGGAVGGALREAAGRMRTSQADPGAEHAAPRSPTWRACPPARPTVVSGPGRRSRGGNSRRPPSVTMVTTVQGLVAPQGSSQVASSHSTTLQDGQTGWGAVRRGEGVRGGGEERGGCQGTPAPACCRRQPSRMHAISRAHPKA